jgi:enoyl-[acyl-carrier protein] reductase I
MLSGKRLVITGVLTDDSIAWHTAKVAQEQGAEVVLTGFGRGLSLTKRSAKRLPKPADVFELDINDASHMESLVAALDESWGGVDGALHAIAYAPEDALGGRFLETPADSAATAFLTSAFSYKTLAVGLLPLFKKAGGGALVSLDFDNSVAWPGYDWMGVSKSALGSRISGRCGHHSAGTLATLILSPRCPVCFCLTSLLQHPVRSSTWMEAFMPLPPEGEKVSTSSSGP